MAEIRVNSTGAVKFYDNDDSHFVGLQAGSISSNVTFTLPTADGSSGQFMKTDGSGALSFATANNYVHPNHSGEVTSTSDGATVIADNIVDEANLKVSNSPSNGYVLTAQSGNTGGLTWAEITGTTINNNADNRIITGSGTANTLEGEANLTYDGSTLTIKPSSNVHQLKLEQNNATDYWSLHADSSGGPLSINRFTGGAETEYFNITNTNATFKTHVLPEANNTYDLGSTSKVWRNIYTSDLNMSNEYLDKGNEVDGTKGSWSIQEGEEDLFLLNRKNGKKYKFNLTEMK